MVVPNERVVTTIVFNHSTGDRTAPATVSVWVPPAADLDQARGVLKPAGAAEVTVAEMTPEGVRIELRGRATTSAPRWATRRRSFARAPTRRCARRACSISRSAS